MLAQQLKDEYRGQIRLAPHGTKRKVAEEIAEQHAMSVSQLYREIDITAGQKKCEREPEIPTEYINLIAATKTDAGKMGMKKRFLTTEDAIDLLEQTDQIPKGLISVSTADRRMRDLGFAKKRTYERHEDDYVNQVHHIDFSRAEYFDVGINKEGEDIIRVDGRKGTYDYKNKPKAERKRLWLVGYIDSYSRAYIVRYFASTGENIAMGTEALEFVWQRADSDHPLLHLPETLKFDQGSYGKYLFHHKTFQKETGVRVELAASKSDRFADQQSQGKIERQFRTLWQKFELKTAQILEAKGVKEITLEDLNALVYDYCLELLEKRHPMRPQSRGEVYRSGLPFREQRRLDVSIWDILFNEESRKVGADKLISYKGTKYKAPSKYAYSRIFVQETNDGRIQGQDLDKHETFDLYEFDADNTEASRTHTETYQERMSKVDPELDGSKLRLVGNKGASIQPHTLPPIEVEQEASTPFADKKVSKPFTDWDLAKMEICKVFNCSWNELADSAQSIFKRLFDAEQLDKNTIEDLYQEVS